ncbi:hypothetical protein BLAC_07590 [Bifidobacterium animalis subsp. lactis ATCC 27673]|uniref:hypothetical protein n=1 Tax=Bifidobacterium animalis TaxID=28025 RepID=UPI0003B06868|nr:hypothetical protein [Bifidobacterium animalis]AGW85689.1 hypothetical protein BLAC_07590 [Bifidobacterium animalis subsp. lactis ATCC 27673]KOA46722.1 hypothetical protein BAAA27673_05585 [Bifidobacterium animalis subsp. lactis ATCC 27673]UBZ01382.1 hypothetical protein LDH92_07675 [Bifidobacterium animalis subsp. lactis]
MHAFLEHADLSILIENPHVLIIDGGLKTVYSGVQSIYFMLESVFLLISPDFIIPVPVKPPDKTHLSRQRQMVAGEGETYIYTRVNVFRKKGKASIYVITFLPLCVTRIVVFNNLCVLEDDVFGNLLGRYVAATSSREVEV